MIRRKTIAVLALCGATACAVSARAPLPLRDERRIALNDGRGGTTTAILVCMPHKGSQLAIVREPHSGVTWWTVDNEIFSDFPERATFPHDSAMVFADGKFIRFTLVFPEMLVVEGSAVFPSLEAAERQIVGGKAPREHWLTRSLSAIPREFLYVPDLAHNPPPAVRSITRTEAGWLITLAGPNGDFIDLTLGPDYSVTDVRRYQ